MITTRRTLTRWCVSAVSGVLLGPVAALAQQAPVPLYPGAMPKTYEAQPLPPTAQPPDYPAPPAPQPPPLAAPPAALLPSPIFPPPSLPPAPRPSDAGIPMPPPAERTFCSQPVSLRVADRNTVGERYRPFIGIWSDASWTPALCAALIVENVAPDGTATIVYAFGPMGSNTRTLGGVLHGTGVIRDGELKFQNSDGSQFSFRPLYSDLDGRLTTPRGQTYGAVFKRSL